MLEEFETLKSFIKYNGFVIDNYVYQLHYKLTFAILILCCTYQSVHQYFGNPIDCMSEDGDDSEITEENIINRYCWIHSTYSVVSAWKKTLGIEVPYPGVDKHLYDQEVIYHAYYQWVSLVLFFQAMAFYIPHMIWTKYEGSIIKKLLNGLDGQINSENDRATRVSMVSEYLYKTAFHYKTRFWIYVFTEILNLANVLAQMYFMEKFLGGIFLNYGTDVMSWSSWSQFPQQIDPMMQRFPRVTKCTFYRIGSSGDIENREIMCFLPINIVNEKIYIILWFWYIIMAVVTGLSLIYRSLQIVLPWLRVISLRRICRCSRDDLQFVLDSSGIGDWFLLYLLAKNMDKQNFSDLIADLKAKKEGIVETEET